MDPKAFRPEIVADWRDVQGAGDDTPYERLLVLRHLRRQVRPLVDDDLEVGQGLADVQLVDAPDARDVAPVLDWLRHNYTLKENPGMGQQGLYYYFHTMAKALHAYDLDKLQTDQGAVPWRKELSLRLLNLQNADGSWANENNRWWEKDPALVTSYAVLTLGIIERGL